MPSSLKGGVQKNRTAVWAVGKGKGDRSAQGVDWRSLWDQNPAAGYKSGAVTTRTNSPVHLVQNRREGEGLQDLFPAAAGPSTMRTNFRKVDRPARVTSNNGPPTSRAFQSAQPSASLGPKHHLVVSIGQCGTGAAAAT